MGLEFQPEGPDDIQVFVEQQAGLGIGIPPCGLLLREPQAVEEDGGILRGGLREHRDAAAVQRGLLHDGDGGRTAAGSRPPVQRRLQGGGLVLGVAYEETQEDRFAAFQGFGTEVFAHPGEQGRQCNSERSVAVGS